MANKVLRVGLLGLEPSQTEPKSVVLPLHHSPLRLAEQVGLEPTT